MCVRAYACVRTRERACVSVRAVPVCACARVRARACVRARARVRVRVRVCVCVRMYLLNPLGPFRNIGRQPCFSTSLSSGLEFGLFPGDPHFIKIL